VARGWESKSIQEQIAAARNREADNKPVLSAEQLEVARKCDALLLHRTRVLHDLEKCRDERYRQTLANGLAYLESELNTLGWTASS
jgi:uncharacterized protein YceH (UPF0502 family)